MKNLFSITVAFLFALVFGTIGAGAVGINPSIGIAAVFATSFIPMPAGLSFMASGFTVSSLTDYVNQTNTDLIAAAQFKGETAAIMGIQTGIKSAEALQILAVDPIPQDGSDCTFTPSGGATFTQRNITVYPVAFQDKFCPKKLNAKWTQLLLKAGSNYDESDIPAKIVEEITNAINRRLETADWQGDTTSGSSYLNRYDGLAKIIKAASGVVAMTSSTINATNIRTILQEAITKVPAALMGDPEFKYFCGYDTYTTYVNKLATDNLYHISGKEGSFGEIPIENSVYTLKAVHGLDGTNEIYGLRPTNAVQGCDMEHEEEKYEMWQFTDGTQNVGYNVQMKRGWQIGIPSEIVKYANA